MLVLHFLDTFVGSVMHLLSNLLKIIALDYFFCFLVLGSLKCNGNLQGLHPCRNLSCSSIPVTKTCKFLNSFLFVFLG